jgi:hypothetical protein
MRFILDIAKSPSGQYHGSLTRPGAAGRHEFAGVLELLAILERQPWPGNHHDTASEGPAIRNDHPGDS